MAGMNGIDLDPAQTCPLRTTTGSRLRRMQSLPP